MGPPKKLKKKLTFQEEQTQENTFEIHWDFRYGCFYLYNPFTGEIIQNPTAEKIENIKINRRESNWSIPDKYPSKNVKKIEILKEYYLSRSWGVRKYKKNINEIEASIKINSLIRGFIGRRLLRRLYRDNYEKVLDEYSSLYYFYNKKTQETYWNKPILARINDIKERKDEDYDDYLKNKKFSLQDFSKGPLIKVKGISKYNIERTNFDPFIIKNTERNYMVKNYKEINIRSDEINNIINEKNYIEHEKLIKILKKDEEELNNLLEQDEIDRIKEEEREKEREKAKEHESLSSLPPLITSTTSLTSLPSSPSSSIPLSSSPKNSIAYFSSPLPNSSSTNFSPPTSISPSSSALLPYITISPTSSASSIKLSTFPTTIKSYENHKKVRELKENISKTKEKLNKVKEIDENYLTLYNKTIPYLDGIKIKNLKLNEYHYLRSILERENDWGSVYSFILENRENIRARNVALHLYATFPVPIMENGALEKSGSIIIDWLVSIIINLDEEYKESEVLLALKALHNMFNERVCRLFYLDTEVIQNEGPSDGGNLTKKNKAIEIYLKKKFLIFNKYLIKIPLESVNVFEKGVREPTVIKKPRETFMPLVEYSLKCLSLLAHEIETKELLCMTVSKYIIFSIKTCIEDPGVALSGLNLIYNLCYRCEKGQEALIVLLGNSQKFYDDITFFHYGDENVRKQLLRVKLSLKENGWRGNVEDEIEEIMRKELEAN